MEMGEYLDTLTGQIRSRKARLLVEEEIKGHIEEQAQAFVRDGMDEEEALREAVRQMGSPVEVGIEMDRIHRPRNNWWILGAVAFLSALGLLVQYLCIYRFGSTQFINLVMAEGAFARQCGYTFMGLALMALLYLCDYSILSKHGKAAGASFLGIIALVCGLDILPVLNGGHSYIKTIMYLFVPIYGGILYSYRGRGGPGIAGAVLWLAAALWTAFGFIGGGLGITFNVAAVCCLMLAVSLFKNWYQVRHRYIPIGVLGASSIILGVYTILDLKEYQLMRLKAVLAPGVYGREAGFQASVTREILKDLSLVGGLQKGGAGLEGTPLELLPGVQYNYVILQAASMWGFLAAGLLAALLTFLLVCLFLMVKRQKNRLGQMIGYGCVLILALDTAGNVLYNMGFSLIYTGGLPFFSYGRCYTLAVYGLLGVLLSIYRYQDLIWENRSPKEDRAQGVVASLGRYRLRIERIDG